ncbi:MAG: DUF5703 domain-containing protein [Anaerolineae bacterium]|nr:DUF5703 domain-containing protein [Anaerolineae bacterium]
MSNPQAYNVTWTSPSKDASGSVPLGNGDITVNAWVEQNGDLLFYIGKTDAWDDNSRLLKVGKIRFTLTPNAFKENTPFIQSLELVDGTMVVKMGSVEIRLWVDANHPVITVEYESPEPTRVTAAIELWRIEPMTLPSLEVSDIMTDRSKPNGQHEPTIVEPDTILTGQTDRIGWYHHNKKSVGPVLTSKIQGLDDFERTDPLLHRTFGAVITTNNPNRLDDQHLESSQAKQHHFNVTILTQHPTTPEAWTTEINKLSDSIEQMTLADRYTAHKQWWHEFWDRSWIEATAQKADEPFAVSQAYALQRYINACSGRGAYPIKFNGSLFTVPYPGQPGDADYRRWGPGYWWQNTRLPYISMSTSGDFDLQQPLFKMYGRDLMPLFRYRTRHYLGHDGIFIPECIYFWGDMFTETYGWTPFEEREDKLQESGYHKWEWVSGPELVYMMFDYYDHTLDETFLRKTLLPTANEVLTFFDQHYETDDSGKMVMHPSQALETWWQCTNPMPEIAGIHAAIERLLNLPEHLTSPEDRDFWKALQAKTPDLPTREINGKRALAAADEYADKRNVENPELYAVFPFRLIAFDRPDVELGLTALEHRDDPGHFGWRQDDVFMAYLGLAEQARAGILERTFDAMSERLGPPNNSMNNSRFPVFWGPNYDWIPDQDHGGILLKTFQTMLLQSNGDKIYLFPAWPKDWDVDFKLHAPKQTIIQGSLKNGEIVELTITPESRRDDVSIML